MKKNLLTFLITSSCVIYADYRTDYRKVNSNYADYDSQTSKDHRYQAEQYRLEFERRQNEYQRPVNHTLSTRKNTQSLYDEEKLEAERRKKIIKENLYNEHTKRFIDILENTIEQFSFLVNLKFLKILKQQCGDSVTFTILNLINSSSKDDFINNIFGSKSKDIPLKNNIKIGSSTYVMVIKALYENKHDKKQISRFIEYVKKTHSENEWKIIESQIKDDSPENNKDNSFSRHFNFKDDLPELRSILKGEHKISPLEIKAQFLIDIIPEFFVETPVNAEFSFLDQTQSSDSQKKIIDAFKNLANKYKSVLSEHRIDTQFLESILSLVKKHVMQEQPGIVAPVFNIFMEQIKSNQELYNKIMNGYRIPVEEAFIQYDTAKHRGSSFKYDTNLMYLLCLEVLARLEKSLFTANEPLSSDEFKIKVKKVLEDIANRFQAESNINGVIKSIFDAAPMHIRAADDKVVFAATLYKLITEMGFSSQQKSFVFERIKKVIDTKNISVDQIKEHEAKKKTTLEVIQSLTAYDTTKSLMPFTAKEKQADDKNNSANALKETTANALIQGIAGLFGRK